MKIEEAVNEEVAIAFGTLTDLGIPQEIREKVNSFFKHQPKVELVQ